MQWAKQIIPLLDKNKKLYRQSLEEIIAAAAKGAKTGKSALAAFVVQQIAKSLLDRWDSSHPLQANEQQIVAKLLQPAIARALQGVIDKAPQDATIESLEALVAAWQETDAKLQEMGG
jgi:hypothetical protein